MAWNPSPEVAAAREAARAIGAVKGSPVDRCVVLFTTESGQIGYASYGKTREVCAQTRRLADVLFDKACEWFAEQEA